MDRIAIEQKNKIRCAACLEWNDRHLKQCSNCTAALIDAVDFGAARALLLWENYSKQRLDTHVKSADDEKVEDWNNLFNRQRKAMLERITQLQLIEPYMVLDVAEDIDKHLLASLPYKPEKFKEITDYLPPDETKSEIDQLQYMFRSHPVATLKALAGIALMYAGAGDEAVFSFLYNWKPFSKKIHQERLLCFSHWSTTSIDTMFRYQHSIDDMLPLYHEDGLTGQWATVFLFKAGYRQQELKYELEELILKAPLHLALTAALALRKYEYVDYLLDRNSINEQTVPLALRYGSEKLIPALLKYLRYAPRHLHEKIVQRIGAMKPESQRLKNKVLDWLFQQDRDEYFEILFIWEKIPRLEKVIDRLVESERGLLVLENKLPQWVDNWPASKPFPAWFVQKISSMESRSRKLKPKLNNVKEQCSERLFLKQCEIAEVVTTPAELKKLYQLVFVSGHQHVGAQVLATGFYKLSKLAKKRDPKGKLRFNLTDASLNAYTVGKDHFLKTIKKFLNESALNTAVNEWLGVLLYELSSGAVTYREAPEVVSGLYDLLLDADAQGNLQKGARTRFLKFIDVRKKLIGQKRIQKLQTLKERHKDFDTTYWVERILEEDE